METTDAHRLTQVINLARKVKILKKMLVFRIVFIFSAVFFVSGVFFSCKKNNGQIEMQNLSPEELSPRFEWALISSPYLACHKDADYESSVIASFRKGEIYEIKGNCTIVVDKGEKDEKKELWYALEEGWVPSNGVKVFSNKLKAEKAKKELK